MMSIFNIKIKCIIMIMCISLYSCNNKKFTINIEEDDFVPIYNLIVEINNKAIKNDIGYFRQAVYSTYKNTFETEIEKIEYYNFLRITYNKEDYDDNEILEYVIVRETESLIKQIIQANIVKTYKNRAYFSNSGINFNYHWDEKDIYFQMYIIKNYGDGIKTETRWRLSSLWKCR